MPEVCIREGLEAVRVRVQTGTELLSQSLDQDAEEDSPFTPHLIVSVARGPMLGNSFSRRAVRYASENADVQRP